MNRIDGGGGESHEVFGTWHAPSWTSIDFTAAMTLFSLISVFAVMLALVTSMTPVTGDDKRNVIRHTKSRTKSDQISARSNAIKYK